MGNSIRSIFPNFYQNKMKAIVFFGVLLMVGAFFLRTPEMKDYDMGEIWLKAGCEFTESQSLGFQKNGNEAQGYWWVSWKTKGDGEMGEFCLEDEHGFRTESLIVGFSPGGECRGGVIKIDREAKNWRPRWEWKISGQRAQLNQIVVTRFAGERYYLYRDLTKYGRWVLLIFGLSCLCWSGKKVVWEQLKRLWREGFVVYSPNNGGIGEAIMLGGVVGVVGAIGLTFSSFQHFQDADSLLSVLISTDHWSFFYWGQNRLGSLVPLMTAWIHHPLYVLLAQSFVCAWAGIFGLYCFAGIFMEKREVAFAGAIALGVLFLLFSEIAIRYWFIIGQPYSVSFGLAFGGWLLWKRMGGSLLMRGALAGICLALAFWVNIGLLPLILLMGGCWGMVCRRERYQSAVFVGFAFLAGVLNAWMASRWSIREEGLFQAITGVFQGIQALLISLASAFHGGAVLLFGVVVGICMVGLLWLDRTKFKQWMNFLGILLFTLLGYIGLLAASAWVAKFGYSVRYLVPLVVLIMMSGGMLIADFMSCCLEKLKISKYRVVAAVLSFVSIGLIGMRFDFLSADEIGIFLADKYGRNVCEMRDRGIQLVVGDYWLVWPMVFVSRLDDYKNAGEFQLDGITYRSFETKERWFPKVGGEGVRVGYLEKDSQVSRELQRFGMKFVQERKLGEWVLGRLECALPRSSETLGRQKF